MSATVKQRSFAIEARQRKPPMSYREIAEIAGVSSTTVRRWVNPEFDARSRAAKKKWLTNPVNRRKQSEYSVASKLRVGRCSSCRGQMSNRMDGVCKKCRREALEFKRIDIARLWNEELLTSTEIAEQMRMNVYVIQTEMVRMRKDGWDLQRRGGRSGAYIRAHQPV